MAGLTSALQPHGVGCPQGEYKILFQMKSGPIVLYSTALYCTLLHCTVFYLSFVVSFPRFQNLFAQFLKRIFPQFLSDEMFTTQVDEKGEWSMGVQQGVAKDSLKFHPCPPCPTLLCPVGEPPLKRPHNRFRDGVPEKEAVCGHLRPLWTPHAVRL
jgi:hypothetical protein